MLCCYMEGSQAKLRVAMCVCVHVFVCVVCMVCGGRAYICSNIVLVCIHCDPSSSLIAVNKGN